MFGHNDDDQAQHINPVTDDDGGHNVPVNTSSSSSTNDDLITSSPVATPAPSTAVNEDELIGLKRKALEELVPLVGHLNQKPEERFKTNMMMIQATDDSSLIKMAYESASQIRDEKLRAQALLDIVNEINYFTQQSA